MSMKRTFLTVLAAAVVGLGLAGCTPDAKPEAETPQTTEKTEQSDQNQTNSQNQTNDTAAAEPKVDAEGFLKQAEDPSHEKVRQAFSLDSQYMNMPSSAITGIVMGQFNLPLEEKDRLALAKAISDSLGMISWTQQDKPPGIFMKKDGTAFAVGYEKQNGALSLTCFERRDGAYQLVKQETKQP